MKTVMVIQARLGSTRLPCKALLTLRGVPVIDWVVRRCQRSQRTAEVIVAIPDTPQDAVLATHLESQGVCVFRGSEQDVLGRMYAAACGRDADAVVRVCADNPLIWGEEIDHLIEFYERERATGCDYAYNHIPKKNQYPDGLGAEIVSFALLEQIAREATLPAHREHCLSFITDQPDRFSLRTFDPPNPVLYHPEIRLDMDTQADFIKLALLDITLETTPEAVIEQLVGAV